MRSFVPVAVAAIPAVLACESPDSHACASAFAYNGAEATAFCATYMTSTVTATAGVPSLFNSACEGKSKSLSAQCTCFVTGGAAAATTAAATATTFATSVKRCSSVFPSFSQDSYSAPSSSPYHTYPTPEVSQYSSAPAYPYSSSQYSASAAVVESTSAAPVAVSTTAAAAGSAGTGASIISTLAGGSGVGGTTCTVTAAADATADAGACSNILLSGVTVAASEGLTLTVPDGGALLFAGTMTVEYTPDSDYTPLVFKGSNAKIAGLAGAVIDGQGAQYWDGEGSNGGSDKPDHFIKLGDMESSSFSDLTIQNWPTHLFEITGCSDMTIQNLILDNSAGDALGHNTDAFDVSSTDGLYVSGATVYNQDDCVAVNSGSNMVFENLYCSGGHGLSIGSISSGVTVSNVTFQDCSVINSANGCRIKTDAGDDDSTVSDITYSNIYLSGITDYAIDVQQDYENGSPTGDPTDGITVSGVTFEYITGTVSGDDAYNYYILCGDDSCSEFTWTDVDVTGGQTECTPSGSICPSS